MYFDTGFSQATKVLLLQKLRRNPGIAKRDNTISMEHKLSFTSLFDVNSRCET